MKFAERLFIAWGVLVILVLGAAPPASAHALVMHTQPGDGSVLSSAPSQVKMTFSESVLLSADSVRVFDPSGKEVERSKAQHLGGDTHTASVPLNRTLSHGTYTVAWKVISADTHPVSGAFTFSIGAPSKTSTARLQQQVGGGAAGLLYGVGRWFAYSGFALLVGVSVFVGVCWPHGARLRVMKRMAVGGWAAMAGSAVLLLLVRGPYADGAGLGTMFDPGRLLTTVQSTVGTALVVRLVLLAGAAAVLTALFGRNARRADAGERQVGPRTTAAGAVIAVGVALTWAAAEHASVGMQTDVAIPVDVVHLLSMAVWLGGLAALVVALFRTDAMDRVAVRRFSRIALGCVSLLVATGVYQSWRQVGSWHALTGTSYGRLLLVKIALVAAMVGAAGFSRRWTGRLGASDPDEGGSAGPAGRPEPAGDPVDSREPVEVMAAGSAAGPRVRTARQTAPEEVAVPAPRADPRREPDRIRRGLRRSVLVETVIAVAVLGATTQLSNSRTARSVVAAAKAQSAGLSLVIDRYHGTGPVVMQLPYRTNSGVGFARIDFNPARTGPNHLFLTLTSISGGSVKAPEVDLSFSLPSRDIGPLNVPLRHLGAGTWGTNKLQLPLSGRWRMAMTVRTSEIDETTVTAQLLIN